VWKTRPPDEYSNIQHSFITKSQCYATVNVIELRAEYVTQTDGLRDYEKLLGAACVCVV